MYNMTRVCNFLYRPPILCNLLMQSKQLVYSAFWWIGSSNWRICCQQMLSKRLNNIQFNELFLALPRQLCGRPCYWLTDKNYIIFLGHWKYDTWLHSKFVIKDHDIWPSKFWLDSKERWQVWEGGGIIEWELLRKFMRTLNSANLWVPCSHWYDKNEKSLFSYPYDDIDENFE